MKEVGENNPKVTVFMPVFNTALYLKEAVSSVLSQSYQDFEFLIIDDGSTDDSFEIIKEFAAGDSRIRVYSRENKGRPATRNEGLLLAKGEFLALMDSDDRCATERLAEQVRFMEMHPDVIACGTAMEYFGDKNGKNLPPVDSDLVNIAMLFTPSIYNATAIMRRAEVMQHNITYRESDLQAQDFRFWCKVAEIGKITNISKVLYFYRIHPAQASQDQRQRQLQIHKNIVWEKLNSLGICLSEEELAAFLLDELRGDAGVESFTAPGEYIHLAAEVFTKLLAWNEYTNIYHSLKLRDYLCHKFENICLLFGVEGVRYGIRFQNEQIRLRSLYILFARLLSRRIKKIRMPIVPEGS